MENNMTESLLKKEDGYLEIEIDFSKLFNSDYSSPKTHYAQTYYTDQIKSPERLGSLLRSNITKGLDPTNKEEMEWRVMKYGNNHFILKMNHSIFYYIFKCFKDPTIIILLCALIISLALGIIKDGIATGWIEATAILFALLLVISITSSLNHYKQKQFYKLNKELRQKKVVVIRNGEENQISIEDVLVGDLLKLKPGDIIEVDGILIGKGKLQIDESAFTGASTLLNKISFWEMKDDKITYKATPILLSGSEVVNGNGTMLVCAVGLNTFEYKTQNNNIATESKSNPNANTNANFDVNDNSDLNRGDNSQSLQSQIEDLTSKIELFGYCIALLIGLIMISKSVIISYSYSKPLFDTEAISSLVNALIISITIIVVAVPEGLPMAISIALAYSIHKLKKEKCLIKNIEAGETLGAINTIITDKTGVITYGELEVVSCWIEKKVFLFPSQARQLTKKMTDLIFKCIYKNTTLVESVDEKGAIVLNGDKTEQALYRFVKRYNLESAKAKGKSTGDIVLPFNSENKYMMSLFRVKDEYVIFAKGNPDAIGQFCTLVQDQDNILTQYSDTKDDLIEQQKTYANQGIRTISFCYKILTKAQINAALMKYPEKTDGFFMSIAQEMTFAYMLGLKDQLRIETPKAIETCKIAGIEVRMITGDDLESALSIGKQIELIDPFSVNEIKQIAQAFKLVYSNRNTNTSNSTESNNQIDIKDINPIALEGEQFRLASGGYRKEYDDLNQETTYHLIDKEKFRKITKKLLIIANGAPDDKLLLVQGLRELKDVVAVTGDKTIDSISFSESDIGFSLGIQGTDLAKRSSDIILLDDSFSSIVTACKYGRNIFCCIRKFIQLQLTTNIVAVFITLLGVIILKTSPLNAIQLLWINVIMDSFASLSLATDSPSDSLLEQKPYKRGEEILTTMMMINISSQAIYQTIILITLMLYGDLIFNVPSDRELDYSVWNNVNGYQFTILFNTFVFMQVFNSINMRKLSKTELNVFNGIFSNGYYLIIQLIIIIGQVLLVSYGGRAVRTQPLSYLQHLICVLIGASTLLIGYIVKLIPFDMNDDSITTAALTIDDKNKERIEEEKSDQYFNKSDYSFGYKSRGNKINYYRSIEQKQLNHSKY